MIEIPIWKKELLTIKEAAALFGIGENKLRDIVREDQYGKLSIFIGNKRLIKRERMHDYILREYSI